MRREAEPAASLAGVATQAGVLGVRKPVHTCTGRMDTWWGKWLVICGEKEKKRKLIRRWGWEECFD